MGKPNTAEIRLIQLVKAQIEDACKRYDPLKMQSSYTSNTQTREQMIEEGWVKNAGEYMALQGKNMSRINRAITQVGNQYNMEFCPFSYCMYPKDD